MSVTETSRTVARSLPAARGAQELGLRRGEFDLAVQLGHIRTTADEAGGRQRVPREEIDRLRAADGFPESLRERLRVVGTAEGAALIGVSRNRFTTLARTGHLTPVRCCLNRYRAVVWLYLAEELQMFADEHPELLTGRLPGRVREDLESGTDRRPRNWRGRCIGLLLRRTDDPWQRAAVMACVLDPVQLAEVVDDPYERAHLTRLRPDLLPGRRDSATSGENVDRLSLADDPDEILWYRVSLALAVDEARADRPAPRPDRLRTLPHGRGRARRRSLLTRLRRGVRRRGAAGP
ncbi:DUF6397 family protein [Streptomyces sannanensis]|uniref:DUF6397 family protein n=1 Tax=Streptomyces sannanensis TaxID=285536 RepID=A0ABP6SLB3_9ACTN